MPDSEFETGWMLKLDQSDQSTHQGGILLLENWIPYKFEKKTVEYSDS